ncbi:MAG: leucine-rich repeat protein [Prevotella sp.]|nr:leucine-rich repeat protein [Prevotella sp.]
MMMAEEVTINGIKYDLNKEGDGTATVIASDYSGDVVIPESFNYNGKEYSVTAIGDGAFVGCKSLSSIAIPSTVSRIGKYAFEGCTGLTSVHISDLKAWCKIDFNDHRYYPSCNPLQYAHHLYLNGEEIKDLVIPSGVTEIYG